MLMTKLKQKSGQEEEERNHDVEGTGNLKTRLRRTRGRRM